jgi:cytochrome c oxidase subunit 4
MDTDVRNEAEDAQPAPAPPHGRHPGVKEYIRIGVVLAIITGAEVAIYYVQKELGGWLLPILFGLSLIKFSLVVMFFMHLKFDSRTYSRFFVMGLAGAITLYLVVLLSLRVFLR